MKLMFNETKSTQPDPFIFEDNGTFYLYVTANAGVEAYESKTLTGKWIYKGTVTAFVDAHDFWAPSVIKLEDKYYMYVSCVANNNFQYMHVAVQHLLHPSYRQHPSSAAYQSHIAVSLNQ